MANWIWTSDKLPEIYTDVLCIDSNNEMFVAYLDDNGVFIDDNCNMNNYVLNYIIAWTSIPEVDIGLSVGMELGNLLWGNSRGNISMDRARQDMMVEILDCLGCDGYGYYCGENKAIENEYGGITTKYFVVRPYYWGEDENIAALPNFEYHNGDTYITIDWYKYPLRDSYSNIKITADLWGEMWNTAIKEGE